VTAASSAAELSARLADRVDEAGRAWLAEVAAAAAEEEAAVVTAFPAVSRRVGREPLDPAADAADPFAATVDDAARALLVAALTPDAAARVLPEVYRHGDARERRGALRALDVLPLDEHPALADAARGLVADALRTNDTRLVAAALGPAGVALLDDDRLADAVLKCLFMAVDTGRIAGLPARTTPELSRMAADFVHERVAAGRSVPPGVWAIVDVHPPAAQLAAITAELDHPRPDRAAAARAALALRG
jgi:hypothetical protein